MAHKFAYGLILFVGVLALWNFFLLPIIQPYLGFAGALIALVLSYTILFILYAWLVMKTGAKPTLAFDSAQRTVTEMKQGLDGLWKAVSPVHLFSVS